MKIVFLDIDGVMTDGAVYVDEFGKETKRILFEDINAIFDLKRAGLKFGFITGENSTFCDYLDKRFSPDIFLRGCKDKLSSFKKIELEYGFDKTDVCYAGDSQSDVELLEYVGLSFAPSDSPIKVKSAAKKVLKSARSNGVVRELVDNILGI